jgi:hypothetical protein
VETPGAFDDDQEFQDARRRLKLDEGHKAFSDD